MESGFIQAGTVRLQYFAHGAGPETIVFVHGYQMSGRVWRLTQEALDPQRFRSFAISNRGAGDSDHTPDEADYRIESLAQDLGHAISALGLHDFTLVGHSMGGGTAVQFALDHASGIKGLVLLDSVGLNGISLAAGWEEQLRERFQRGEAPVERPVGAATLEEPPPTDYSEALQADVARNSLQRLIGSRRSMGEVRLRDRLTELSMPVLVVGGDQDTTVGIDQVLTDFLALRPDRRSLHIFHGIGHSPNSAVPTQLAAVLDGFILRTLPSMMSTASSVQ
jgi:pimeloyl-ACP methyl ester carboxylesterase